MNTEYQRPAWLEKALDLDDKQARRYFGIPEKDYLKLRSVQGKQIAKPKPVAQPGEF